MNVWLNLLCIMQKDFLRLIRLTSPSPLQISRVS